MLYQDNGRPVSMSSRDSYTPVTSPVPVAHAKSQDPRLHRYHHRPIGSFDEPNSRISGSSEKTLYGHYQTPSVEIPVPEPARSTASPYLSSPRMEDGMLLTPSSNSSGAARKEMRTQDSLSRGSSPVSGQSLPRGALSIEQANDFGNRDSNDNRDALLLLFRISFLVPIFSFLASFYAIFSFLSVVVISPLRICSCFRSTTFGSQICDLLGPSIRFHERLICTRSSSSSRSSPAPRIYIDSNEALPTESNEYYSVPGLMTVLILSTFLCIGLVLAAWTAAFFWVFAMVLGNPEPDGPGERDDGCAAVLGVGKWWEKWLRKARKSPPR